MRVGVLCVVLVLNITIGTVILCANQDNVICRRIRNHLNLGYHVDQQDARGNSSLMLASRYGHIAAVHLLLKRGADPYLINNNGDSAFSLALRGLEKQQDIVRLMSTNRFFQGVDKSLSRF